MEQEITNPKKKVDWKQLFEDAGVILKGVRTKGDKMFLLDTSKLDANKIEVALATHKVIPKVLTTAEQKSQQIRAILNS